MQDLFLPSEQNVASHFRQWRVGIFIRILPFTPSQRVRECVTTEAPQLNDALNVCMSQKGYPKLDFSRLEFLLARGMDKLALFLDTPSLIQQSCREPQTVAECVRYKCF